MIAPKAPPVRTVLLTGFEPFDSHPVNPSIEAVRLAATRWDRPERLVVAELPVAYTRAGEALATLLAEHSPDVVIGVGLAAGRPAIALERVAINLCDAPIPDNDGAQPTEGSVLDGEPAAIFTSLPVKATLERLRAAGLDANLSLSAGSYVCNAVFFRAAAWAAGQPARRAGFVHVPLPTADGGGSVSLDDLARAILISADVALDADVDAGFPAGATH